MVGFGVCLYCFVGFVYGCDLCVGYLCVCVFGDVVFEGDLYVV